MLTALAPSTAEAAAPVMPALPDSLLDRMRPLIARDLAPHVGKIDQEGIYPEAALRSFGAAGAFAAHTGAVPDLNAAIAAMSLAGEHCLSTAFCMWCQDALGWYLAQSDNPAPRAALLDAVAAGRRLGGTGLSNPMKCFFGIEPLKLRAKRVEGGYEVSGGLPWVSNLGENHLFGAVFEMADDPAHRVMAIIDCSREDIVLRQATHFLGLEGTRTVAVTFRKAFIPDSMVIADPVEGFIKRIRAGFILLQAGMAFGLIEGCIRLMRGCEKGLGHINKYLPEQPGHFEEALAALRETVQGLAATPFETDPGYWRAVIESRLAAGEWSLKAAQAAMLHAGASGYIQGAPAQRRMRESYFVAIVTPATKQLRKMLADIDGK
ncbi:acyl-CoA dehydrogenase family protein [Ferrovibrio sp.]|uniref:acyl-CoA dehydrogenase family protein n=1 Tax=Ferrovibrio sp. TaxID=1917215 RepID=UPI00311E22D5